MRRLGKPCWMLVYNNDGHNLKKLANKFDLSIRMNQFFDHYLKHLSLGATNAQFLCIDGRELL